MNKFSKFKKAAISKSEMKVVKGGGGTCAYTEGNGWVTVDVSKSEALAGVANGGRWCCDSCHKATWIIH